MCRSPTTSCASLPVFFFYSICLSQGSTNYGTEAVHVCKQLYWDRTIPNQYTELGTNNASFYYKIFYYKIISM